MALAITDIDQMEYASDALARTTYRGPSYETPTDFDDDFTGSDGDPISSTKWTIDGSPDIQGNAAELYNEEYLTSKYTFTNDFSVQVDFEFQSPPAANSYSARLLVSIDSTHKIYISAARYSGNKYWQRGYINGGSWTYDGYSGRSNDYGQLKIVRSGASFSVYTVDGAGAVTERGSAVTVGSTGNTVSVILMIDRWDTLPNVTCRFDNYLINSGYLGTSDVLDVFSESSIKSGGSYSLKAFAAQTVSLNETLIRTISSPLNLSGKTNLRGFIRASRTGSNIKIGFHDSGGTTTEVTPNIASADTWQLIDLDISGVSDANKDAIDQIIITITNADADNTFYLDNLFAVVDPALAVSKSTAYAVLKTPEAVNVSKAVAYVVLSTEVNVAVSKAVAYAVLAPAEPEPSESQPMMYIF